jgi:hypothetical protein
MSPADLICFACRAAYAFEAHRHRPLQPDLAVTASRTVRSSTMTAARFRAILRRERECGRVQSRGSSWGTAGGAQLQLHTPRGLPHT